MSGQHRPDDEALDLGGADLYGKPRRVERATLEALEAARLSAVDAAAAAVARELARAVDVASTRKDPYGVATAARELREQLIRLRMDPTSREGAADGFAAWLDSLEDDDTAPTVPHGS